MSRRGFTLIEVVLGVGLFAVVLLGLTAMFLGFSGGEAHARGSSTATELASSELTRLEQFPYELLETYLGDPPGAYDRDHAGTLYHVLARVAAYEPDPLSPDHPVLRLSLQVGWTEHTRLELEGERRTALGQADRQLSLTTLLSPESTL